MEQSAGGGSRIADAVEPEIIPQAPHYTVQMRKHILFSTPSSGGLHPGIKSPATSTIQYTGIVYPTGDWSGIMMRVISCDGRLLALWWCLEWWGSQVTSSRGLGFAAVTVWV